MAEQIQWTLNKTFAQGIYKKCTISENDTIAAFDLDNTIIKFKDKDFNFLTETVLSKILQILNIPDCKFIIVTNQKGLNKKKEKLDTWLINVGKLLNKITIPCMIFASFDNDKYRKPLPNILTDNIKFKREGSFFCGDAGGNIPRFINGIKYEADFSDTDAKFASNLNITFIHRDHYFLCDISNNYKISYNIKIDDAISMDEWHNLATSFLQPMLTNVNGRQSNPEINNRKHVIIMVGMPGSGKSTMTKYLCDNYGYISVNQDTLKTKAKCIKYFKEQIALGNNIIIDNTNPSVSTRSEYIKITSILKHYDCYCIHFDIDRDTCYHNNIYRYLKNNTLEIVPKIAYAMYSKNYAGPTVAEGFTNILTINKCIKNDDLEYAMYLF